MHKELMKIKMKNIPEEDHLKPHKFGVKNTFGFNFREAENKYLRETKIIHKSKLRKSIIHSDFQDVNLLFKNNKVVAILDWADVNKTALVYDIAIFICHSFVKKNRIEKEKIRTFLKIYQREIRLNDDEKRAIYFMMKRRLLGVLIWCYTMSKEHKDMAKTLKKWAAVCIKCYKTLEKFPLEDFLRLCD